MTDQTPEASQVSETNEPDGGANMTLRIGATVMLGCAALVVLALAGGSLNITSTGLTMNVNPPQ